MTTQDHRAETTNPAAEDQYSPARADPSTEGAESSTAGADASMSETDSTRQTESPTVGRESATEGAESSTVGADVSMSETDSTRQTESPTVGSESAPEGAVPSTEESLFAEDELSGLRVRWADVQAAFVDDPRECVHKADGLVSDVVDQLTTGFSEARSRLESQWARGEQASTEELRLALKRYREFFERLLAV
jgi:hypothetical protein